VVGFTIRGVVSKVASREAPLCVGLWLGFIFLSKDCWPELGRVDYRIVGPPGKW